MIVYSYYNTLTKLNFYNVATIITHITYQSDYRSNATFDYSESGTGVEMKSISLVIVIIKRISIQLFEPQKLLQSHIKNQCDFMKRRYSKVSGHPTNVIKTRVFHATYYLFTGYDDSNEAVGITHFSG